MDAIDEGEVSAWEYDEDGDLTCSTGKWKGEAWFRPEVAAGVLQLWLLVPDDEPMPEQIYGVYHSRLIRVLLTSFSEYFAALTVTVLQEAEEAEEDDVKEDGIEAEVAAEVAEDEVAVDEPEEGEEDDGIEGEEDDGIEWEK